ncbi:biotin--[acetyl-CoA-carboxylase] ligase [Phaeovibrio sulfidiphilus]|uniref:biotin--[acetyl-CoA-carboxylase] ligase n=1 Tax=Phaeovibrio sulfidiphilus TaxID=1220600 RepID=UPI001F548D22|nr:biotin--[acetyl-CoA-carboxylase] ligase [Phaeovibrio sulfidiphilus]
MQGETPVLPAGWSLSCFEELESTSRTARERVERGEASDGQIIWALSQTGGRGRMGRGWSSPRGNLYQSCLVRAPADPARAAEASFVAAVATARALEILCPASQPRCKWPNDIFCQGAKVSGILLELARGPGEGGEPSPWLIVGIGINLALAPDTPSLYPAAALADFGVEVSPAAALEVLADCLCGWLSVWRTQGFGPVREAWLSRAMGLGEPVEVRLGAGQVLRGHFGGLDTTGRLALTGDDGVTIEHYISAGDVFFQGM